MFNKSLFLKVLWTKFVKMLILKRVSSWWENLNQTQEQETITKQGVRVAE